MKHTKYLNVVSCSGMTDIDLLIKEKCPFYADKFAICALTGEKKVHDMEIPKDCKLRKYDINVFLLEKPNW